MTRRQLVPRSIRSLPRSWERWRRMRRLKHQVRRLRRLTKKEARREELQLEFLRLVEQLEHPVQVLSSRPQSASPTPTLETTPPAWEVPPPLTPEEIAELKAMPMPDPVEEIEHRLGLSTTPPSPRVSAG